ncbi:hypothetical protein TH63_05660 [Rufibacter radiotolerans]|uniref:Uncharacterized protein n=1 Tax=Rufibacter radiotolerans TaxID=1379910 RepID=A0A0H4VIL4_9BACT|nr:hypothetical protein [Rufibacter radiotolerans]AKQ45238.1 hypothetical protein TH63_05660 [Rufibacter radiotolerans]
MSCEKEDIAPNNLSVNQLQQARETGTCTAYFYATKDGSTVSYGVALGDVVLVSFVEGTPAKDIKKILSQYPEFIKVESEFSTETSLITVLRLTPNTTCFAAEQMIASLETKPEVKFALPAFDNGVDEQKNRRLLAMTDELLVGIEPTPEALAQLQAFVASTNSKIVFSYSEEFHLLSVDKTSSGNSFELTTLLNQQGYVTGADPSLVVQALKPL